MIGRSLGQIVVWGGGIGIVLLVLGAVLLFRRRHVALGVPLVLLAIAVAVAIVFVMRAPIVYVATNGGEEPVVTQQLLVFDATYTIPGGKSRALDHEPNAWLINQSQHELSVVEQSYGPSSLQGAGLGGTLAIKPNTIMKLERPFDHIGPSDPPPREVSSSTIVDRRFWLTW
jgi:uncharacterized protein (TIGR03382 family)